MNGRGSSMGAADASFPRAQTVEKDGEISCSVEETNRLRSLLGLAPLRVAGSGGGAARSYSAAPAGPPPTSPTGEDPAVRAAVTESNGEISCSVEETNRIRASLGLKPLRMGASQQGRNGDHDDGDDGPARRRQAAREQKLAREQMLAAEAQREVQERIAHAQKQRKLRAKLEGNTLGDETARDGESAADWLAKSTGVMKGGAKAKDPGDPAQTSAIPQKRSRRRPRGEAEDATDGVRVAHNLADLAAEGDGVVLTLKDSGVLDEASGGLAEAPDELEDHRLASRKRVAEAHAKIRRQKGEPSLAGIEANEPKSLLAKYDDVDMDHGAPKRRSQKSAATASDAAPTVLQSGGRLEAAVPSADADAGKDLSAAVAERLREVKEQQAGFAVFQQMQDYYTAEEYGDLVASKRDRKKDKKKKKKEKKRKSKHTKEKRSENEGSNEDYDLDANEAANADNDETIILRRHGPRTAKKAGTEPDGDLGPLGAPEVSRLESLPGARGKTDLSSGVSNSLLRPEDIALQLARDRRNAMHVDGGGDDNTHRGGDDDDDDGALVLSSTAEFTSRIKAQANDRAEDRALGRAAAGKRPRNGSEASGAHGESNAKKARATEGSPQQRRLPRSHNILGDAAFQADAEAAAGGPGSRQGGGLTSALSKLRARGDLDPQKHANNIIIGRANDAKPIVDDGPGPKLEYRDEQGRLMTQKEAFRAINHAFHGQKPNFKKLAKRQREIDRQVRMLKAAEAQMSTAALKKHQESTGQAYLKLD